jgi:glycogen debranching enzyme
LSLEDATPTVELGWHMSNVKTWPTAASAALQSELDPEPDALRDPLKLFALKHADTFLVADPTGDVLGDSDGLFDDDTRILSHYRLTLAGRPPSLLGSAVSQDNVFFTANMTNLPLPPLGGIPTPKGVIHIERKRLLWQRRLYERIALVNYSQSDRRVPLALSFAADFRDMFEVRGRSRPARGRVLPPDVSERRVLLRYIGLDGVLRASAISFSEAPTDLSAERAEFLIELPANGRTHLFIEIGPEPVGERPEMARFRRAAARARWSMRAVRRRGARLATPNRLFNEWIEKSAADLALLTTELPTGPYPYAGIPWFSTPFGRDAIVTALQTVWLDPSLARGVLAFLAENQAHERSPFRDSAPGKILHEMRRGEMTALQELPFGRYYGGVDTTPLFVVLAGAYADRTGDSAFIDQLWPALTEAMAWIEGEGDSNGDGLLDYARGRESGLVNQGWKDSADSIFHADGRFPEGPIALVEVQGYVYAACRAMAELAARRGEVETAEHWRGRAEALREIVERRFWMADTGLYGIALDGNGELCRVRASNAGHLLFTGLAAPERAVRVAEQLASPAFNSGWGIRTLAKGEARFNPMSYHNGSVWPHDTALCAAGMARYGDREQVLTVLNQLFEAAVQFGMRLPELFCGFPRSPGEAPIPYPVACLPQAWAAGSVFMLLQACLGLTIDGWRGEVLVDRPALPIGVERLRVRQLPVGRNRIDLTFQRVGDEVVCISEGKTRSAVKIIAGD